MAYIGQKPGNNFRPVHFKDTFTGDGSTTIFDLTQAFNQAGDTEIQVFVNNVRQEPGSGKSYTVGIDGNGDYKRITFTVAPPASSEIYVINPGVTGSVVAPTDNSVTSGKLNTDVITGQTELSAQAADDDVLLVYDTSATSIKKIQKSNIATTLSYSVNSNLTGDGSTTAFTIGTSDRTANDILVSVDGILFHPSDDYTLSGTTLTFTQAPVASAEIRVRYLPA